MIATSDRSSTVTANQTLNAPPHQIFPLLCPVREYDWIDDWSCAIISSRTGIAELNCVFTTKRDYGHSKPKDEIWIVSRYEPPRVIEFVKFCADLYVIKYDIWLNSLAENLTQAVWTQTRIPLSADGEAALEATTQEAFQTMAGDLESRLNDYLETDQ